jgi:hypothetical protein
MMDSYQAIYDAVRSRISNGDIGNAVEQAFHRADIGFQFQRALQNLEIAGAEMSRPSVLFRPKLSIDGNQWCALYGENLQDGCAGFGDSPEKAMMAFDVEWAKEAAHGPYRT